MSSSHRDVRRLAFAAVTSACVVVALAYTFFAARKAPPADAPAAIAQPAPSTPAVSNDAEADRQPQVGAKSETPSPPVVATPLETPHSGRRHAPRLVAINWRDSEDRGSVEIADVDIDTIGEDRTELKLRCERVHVAARNGICLSREIKRLSAATVATLFDAEFQPRFSVRVDGIPTRARMSADGRYAAFTVFVTGHSYADAQLSTATVLLDVSTGATVANLEQFTVARDGKRLELADRNYWGVTFERDSNFFYATLRTGGINYLAHGDISAQTITMVYEGVECPSLSPDQTRVAFKKKIAANNWRLTVLDLTTFEETPLAETRSVDDQPEWLDDEHVLYGVQDQAPWMSIMMASADGKGRPAVFANGAASPAVLRR